MKSRAVAVIGALALIVLAIVARNHFAADGNGSGDPKDPGQGDGLPVIACTPDLSTVCDALVADGAIARGTPSLDLDGASQPPADVDAWITWNPAPQIANFDAGTTKVWSKPIVLGSATQAVLADALTAGGFEGSCRSELTYRCLAEDASGLSIGVGDPATSEGIARIAPFAEVFAPDGDYLQLDTEGLRALAQSPSNDADRAASATVGAERMTTTAGAFNLVAGPNDALLAASKTPRGEQRGLRVLSPKPSSKLVAVVADRAGRGGSSDDVRCKGDDADAVSTALVELGLQPCEGTADDALAGFLYQVQKKVG